jgi:nucleoside-diphosphate-sugar epimerase
MRVLVTGGAGNVGTAVCRRLVERHEVASFDLRPPSVPGVRYLRGDILNSADLVDAVQGMEAVVHLAAIPHPGWDSSDAIMNVNVMGTQRVLQAAALGDPRRVVVASSDSTFGFVFGRGEIMPQYLPVDEVHPALPRDAYGLSKLIKEETCRRYTRDVGLETICLRYCWVWGPGDYANLAEWSRHPAHFVGQLWGYVDARDVAQAVEKSLLAPGITHETLSISAASTFMREPSLELTRRFLSPVPPLQQPEWFAANPRRCLIDCTRAREVIGFEPEYDCWDEAGLTA